MKQKERKYKGYFIAYDLVSLPRTKIYEEVLFEMKENGVCFWDSSLGGGKPKLFHLGGNDRSYLKNVKIIDLNFNGTSR